MNESKPIDDKLDMAAASTTQASARAAVVLQGNEIVELSIKPSLWFIPIVSCRIVIAMSLFAAAIALINWDNWNVRATIAFQMPIGIAVFRIGVAMLQWASRVYLLTNRRVLKIQGVLEIAITDCPLSKISDVSLKSHWYQKVLRIGSVYMTPCDSKLSTVNWKYLSHSKDVHERLIRAVRKAQSR